MKHRKNIVEQKRITPQEIVRIDATGKVVGRLAEEIANHLNGKLNPRYVPYQFCGDDVVITNAKDIVLTGRKDTQKMYFWHSLKIGSLKSMTATELRKTNPNKILLQAVKGMLPKNRLRDVKLTHLHIYAGEEATK